MYLNNYSCEAGADIFYSLVSVLLGSVALTLAFLMME